MVKTVLVTGSGGFVGFNLCSQLVASGAQVVGVDNNHDDGDLVIKARRTDALRTLDRFKMHSGSICDNAFLRSVFESERFDAVVHLAALAGVRASADEPRLFADANVLGTVNLLELCREHKVGKFLFASSSSTYGGRERLNLETDKIDRPLSVYAASKGAAEQLCYVYSHLYKMDVGIMRFFTVYGRWGRPGMLILALIKRIEQGEKMPIFGKGDAVRTYIYVDDVVNGISAVLDKGAGYQTFNLAGSERVTVNEVIKLVEEALGKRAKIVNLPANPSDAQESSGDIAFAKKTLGWAPRHSMRAGIQKTTQWYLDNRDWLIDAIPPANL